MLQVIVNVIAVLTAIYMVVVMSGIAVMMKMNKNNLLVRAYQDMVSKKFAWLYLATAFVVGLMGLYYPSNYVYSLIAVIAVSLVGEQIFMVVMRKRINTMIVDRIKQGDIGYSDQKIW